MIAAAACDVDCVASTLFSYEERRHNCVLQFSAVNRLLRNVCQQSALLDDSRRTVVGMLRHQR